MSYFSSLFRRPRRTLEELEDIREHRSTGIRRVLAVSGLILLTLVAFVVSTLVLPPLRELDALKLEHEDLQKELAEVMKEEEESRNICTWIREDGEYVEQIARDRADKAKEGEKVIRLPDNFGESERPAPVEPRRGDR